MRGNLKALLSFLLTDHGKGFSCSVWMLLSKFIMFNPELRNKTTFHLSGGTHSLWAAETLLCCALNSIWGPTENTLYCNINFLMSISSNLTPHAENILNCTKKGGIELLPCQAPISAMTILKCNWRSIWNAEKGKKEISSKWKGRNIMLQARWAVVLWLWKLKWHFSRHLAMDFNVLNLF